jgi:hypothetical protein
MSFKRDDILEASMRLCSNKTSIIMTYEIIHKGCGNS